MNPARPPTPAAAVCLHCGTAFRPNERRRQFCCSGCQFVHDLIAKNGLGQFYELQTGGVQPVKSLVFQKRDYTWLEELARHAEASPQSAAALRLDLQGVSCIGCAWLIEKVFAQLPGALSLHVDPALGTLDVRWTPGVFDVVAFARQLQSFGYLVGPPALGERPASRALIIRLGLCAALAMNTMLFTLPGYLGMEAGAQFAPLFARGTLILSTLSLLIGGSYFFGRSWRSLRQGVLHIDLPISLGLGAAYLASVYAWTRGVPGFVYFDFVSVFVFLMLGGRWLQQKAIERNRHLLLTTRGDLAPIRIAGSEEKRPVAALEAGAVYFVEPGQPIPVRSMLRSEGATLGLEWINGESEAATARQGKVVPSGAINCGACALELFALEAWPQSVLASLVQIAAPSTYRNHALEQFIRAYIFIVLGIGSVAFAVWWWLGGDLLSAMQVFISILVVSCPCASGVALPLADDLAAAQLRRVGVFVRESSLWARLGRVRKILFDKTGTLTLETMALQNPEALAALAPNERAVLLALVQDSLHPVSGALRELLLADGLTAAEIPPVNETVGCGLSVTEAGREWRLGRAGWAGVAEGDCVFSREGSVLAAFRFGEDLREDAAEEVAALRRRGCEVYLLSGDRREKVDAMAKRLALPVEQCHAGMSPQEKADWVRAHDAEDTLLIGDGANDSLAFNDAFCTGTPAIDRGLLEQKADFFFLGRGLAGVRRLLEAADTRRRNTRRVLAFALSYNAVAIALSLAGRMSPLVAAVLMPLSSLVSLAIVFVGQPKTRRSVQDTTAQLFGS